MQKVEKNNLLLLTWTQGAKKINLEGEKKHLDKVEQSFQSINKHDPRNWSDGYTPNQRKSDLWQIMIAVLGNPARPSRISPSPAAGSRRMGGEEPCVHSWQDIGFTACPVYMYFPLQYILR